MNDATAIGSTRVGHPRPPTWARWVSGVELLLVLPITFVTIVTVGFVAREWYETRATSSGFGPDREALLFFSIPVAIAALSLVSLWILLCFRILGRTPRRTRTLLCVSLIPGILIALLGLVTSVNMAQAMPPGWTSDEIFFVCVFLPPFLVALHQAGWEMVRERD